MKVALRKFCSFGLETISHSSFLVFILNLKNVTQRNSNKETLEKLLGSLVKCLLPVLMNTKLTILVKLKPILRLLSIDFSDLENNKISFFLFRLYPPHASSHNNIGVLLQDTHSEV